VTYAGLGAFGAAVGDARVADQDRTAYWDSGGSGEAADLLEVPHVVLEQVAAVLVEAAAVVVVLFLVAEGFEAAVRWEQAALEQVVAVGREDEDAVGYEVDASS
jgi:hypothetical protein